MLRALVVGLAALAGCAHEVEPPAVARAYLEALARGDVARAHALSIREVRTTTPAAALSTLPGSTGLDALSAAAWTIELAGGRRLTVTREQDGAWYVDDDAVRARSLTDPRGAAMAFLEAALVADPRRTRAFLPDAESPRFADDAVLRAYLTTQHARLERVRVALGDAARRTAHVEGDQAQIPYDGRRALRLVRERGVWRVMDLE